MYTYNTQRGGGPHDIQVSIDPKDDGRVELKASTPLLKNSIPKHSFKYDGIEKDNDDDHCI
jgi:hypothetical protein